MSYVPGYLKQAGIWQMQIYESGNLVHGSSLLRESIPTRKTQISAPGRPWVLHFAVPVIWTLLVALSPTLAWSADERFTQLVDAHAEGFLNCDRRAEAEAAQASKLTPVAPVSVLNPVLLLNDLHRRKLEEENQPRLLEQIELRRQQCRKEVIAAVAYRAQEALDQKNDVVRG